MSQDILIQMKNIDMFFPGVKALQSVDFTLRKGEIHSLMGENGAGKSTLVKVLTGVYKRSGGEIEYLGENFTSNTPIDAQLAGINTVYQEINLCDNLSVAENIFAGRQPIKLAKIDWKTMSKRAEQALQKLHVHIDVTQNLGSYPVAIKQMVAISRAVNMSSKVLILDEPTSSLDSNEVEQLFSIMRELKNEGMGIIFISHFLDQIYTICDQVTVLRNGKLVGEYKVKSLPRLELISKMIGKEINDIEKNTQNQKDEQFKEVIVEAKQFGKKQLVNPFDLQLKKGEVLGFAGLLGSGRTEVASLLFGAEEADEGELFIAGKKISLKSPRDAINKKMAFCPEDRKKDGIFYDLSVRENIIIALQARKGIFKHIPKKQQVEIASQYITLLGIITPDCEKPVGMLSGGNQQKVILARWLVTEPEVLILDEPTRGIDINAKSEIMNVTLDLCKKGMSIVFISSELEEVVRCSNRVAIMCDRKKIAEVSGTDLESNKILKTIASGGQ